MARFRSPASDNWQARPYFGAFPDRELSAQAAIARRQILLRDHLQNVRVDPIPTKQRTTPTLLRIMTSARFSVDRIWGKPSAIIPASRDRAAMLSSVLSSIAPRLCFGMGLGFYIIWMTPPILS